MKDNKLLTVKEMKEMSVYDYYHRLLSNTLKEYSKNQIRIVLEEWILPTCEEYNEHNILDFYEEVLPFTEDPRLKIDKTEDEIK